MNHDATQLVRPDPICRYAPSPTGPLHLGNTRTALLAWQDCRQRGGTFILRMEDTDRPRTVAGAAEAILEDLRWLGINWDEGPDVGGPVGPYTQSQRNHLYLAALRQLADQGLIYPCTCSRRNLQSLASAPHGKEGPIYPGTCRRVLSRAEIAPYLEQVERCVLDMNTAQHLPFSLRFNVQNLPPAVFLEEGVGFQHEFLAETSGDFVVFRRDALWAYQFACATDDALMGVTRVVRGEDLRFSTGKQVGIITALGHRAPTYRHVGLAADSAGRRMSKRDGSDSIRSLRERGISPAEICELCLKLPLVKPCT